MTPAQRGNLEIVDEVVMTAIPRGDDELRVTFTRGRTPEGRDVAWHSIRVFYKDPSGEWRPGKGVTIRGRELAAVAAALAKVASGGCQPERARSDDEIPF